MPMRSIHGLMGNRFRAGLIAMLTLCPVVLVGAQRPAGVPLTDLAFISGHWKGEIEGSVTDDFWSLPEGDCIIGMYRELKDGKVTMYEFLSIEQTGSGPVLLLKHFNRGLEGWEEKNQSLSLPLISWKPNDASFERADRKVRLTFHRTTPDMLETTLTVMKDGKINASVFREKRAD